MRLGVCLLAYCRPEHHLAPGGMSSSATSSTPKPVSCRRRAPGRCLKDRGVRRKDRLYRLLPAERSPARLHRGRAPPPVSPQYREGRVPVRQGRRDWGEVSACRSSGTTPRLRRATEAGALMRAGSFRKRILATRSIRLSKVEVDPVVKSRNRTMKSTV